MLFQHRFLDSIAQGTVTLAFRRWRRPSVRTGGTLRTPSGVIAIDSLETVEVASITQDDAQSAGFSNVEELVKTLMPGSYLPLYRIGFHFLGEDPRTRLRQTTEIDPKEEERIAGRLERLDRSESWTARVLADIREYPGTRSTELAARVGMDVVVLKTRIRELKELGLTESLGTGYRISPRGEAWMAKSR
jgi:hypothetical protein